ncbi:MAG: YbaK/EbsC family protein [Candidatus Elarobacter sp.]
MIASGAGIGRARENRRAMTLGSLDAVPALTRPELLAPPVAAALAARADATAVGVAEIDPDLADTQAFCERYGVALERSANCVIVAARREGRRWFAACLVLATTRADVNGFVKKHLGASKISFAPLDEAVAETGMEYGGITPIGLPAAWPVLIDEAVIAADAVVIGSGVRRSKLILPGTVLAATPNAVVTASLAVAR